jgi:hypothetical protein
MLSIHQIHVVIMIVHTKLLFREATLLQQSCMIISGFPQRHLEQGAHSFVHLPASGRSIGMQNIFGETKETHWNMEHNESVTNITIANGARFSHGTRKL